MAGMAVVASLVGTVLAPRLSKIFGKKEAALLGYLAGAAGELIPYFLRMADWMPQNGDARVFYIVTAGRVVTICAWSITGVCISAMIADLVEDNAVKTGRRSEGFLFAADSLFKKIASAGGPALSGLILSVVHFPVGAKKGHVDPAILHNLILLYVPLLIAIYAVSMGIMAFYNIDRTSHAANLEALRRE
jgi:Na+/melibiose symporter-like transporter